MDFTASGSLLPRFGFCAWQRAYLFSIVFSDQPHSGTGISIWSVSFLVLLFESFGFSARTLMSWAVRPYEAMNYVGRYPFPHVSK